MALQDIIKYISENKDSYPIGVLVGQLRKSGYPENEILEAIEELKRQKAQRELGAGAVPQNQIKDVPKPMETNKILWWIAGFAGCNIAAAIIGVSLLLIGGFLTPTSSPYYLLLEIVNDLTLTALYYYYVRNLSRKSVVNGYLTALVLGYIFTALSILSIFMR